MKIKTKAYGVVEINDEDIITFEEGLVGFDNMHKFVLLGNPQANESLVWLQSLENENLAFVVIQPLHIRPDFLPEVQARDLADLKLEDSLDALLYAIVTIPQEVKEMTVNLKAPLVINVKNNRGKQIILNDDKYQIKESIIVGN